jgi:hypothetical protein
MVLSAIGEKANMAFEPAWFPIPPPGQRSIIPCIARNWLARTLFGSNFGETQLVHKTYLFSESIFPISPLASGVVIYRVFTICRVRSLIWLS